MSREQIVALGLMAALCGSTLKQSPNSGICLCNSLVFLTSIGNGAQSNGVDHMTFKVNVVPTDFAVTAGGNVSGPFWFIVAGEAFPDENWLDFIEPAFATWVREAFSLALGISGSARVEFMDGPYVAIFELGDNRQITADFSANGVSREFLIDQKEFGKALVDAIRLLIQGYRSNGLEASEWERYEVALRNLGIGV